MDRSIWWCFGCPGRKPGNELVLRCGAERMVFFDNYLDRLADMLGAWYLHQWARFYGRRTWSKPTPNDTILKEWGLFDQISVGRRELVAQTARPR